MAVLYGIFTLRYFHIQCFVMQIYLVVPLSPFTLLIWRFYMAFLHYINVFFHNRYIIILKNIRSVTLNFYFADMAVLFSYSMAYVINIFGGATLTLYFANIAVLSASSVCHIKKCYKKHEKKLKNTNDLLRSSALCQNRRPC